MTRIPSIASKINVGDTVDVFYAVKASNRGSIKSIWWPSTVQKASYVSHGVVDLFLTLQFVRMFGFKESTEEFKVIDENWIEDSAGDKYSWKHSSIVVDVDDEIISVTDLDVKDKEEEILLDSKSIDGGITKKHGGHFHMMSSRLEEVERELKRMKRSIEFHIGSQSHDNSSGIRKRLAFFLNKFLKKTSTAKRKDLLLKDLVRQHIFSASADCSLSQMDSILWDVDHLMEEAVEDLGILFEPSLKSIRMTQPDEIEISFPTFTSFASFFGISHQDAQSSIVSKIFSKQDINQLQVIGSELHGTEDCLQPWLLGFGVNVHLCIPVCDYVFRRTREWNNIENTFVHGTNVVPEKEKKDRVEQMKTVTSPSSLEKDMYFRIVWEGLQKKELASVFTSRLEILGTITIYVPFLTIRSKPICMDILNKLSMK